MKAVLHCWETGPETEGGMSTTCMLPYDHDGPHQWTRDDEVRVRFMEDAETAQKKP